MKVVNCTCELIDGRLWSYLDRSGPPGKAPVHEVLRWVLQQINFGNFTYVADANGEMTALTIGAGTAPPIDDATPEEVAERVKARLLTTSVAGVFARTREEGVKREHQAVADRIRASVTPTGRMNTALHYALELVNTLQRIEQLTFVFRAPPIKARAGDDVVELLREATRAYLFGLNRACVAACRALLEAALRELVHTDDVAAARLSGVGELEAMIRVAARGGQLSTQLVGKAHRIRKAGNNAVHRAAPSDAEAWKVLVDTRIVVTALHQGSA